MNILFVGEAVSGFGGIETVLKKVTGFLENDSKTPNTYTLYFLCRDDRMDKTWLQGKHSVCHQSGIKISFLRRLSQTRALARFLDENNPDVVIAFDTPSCRIASQAIKRVQHSIPLFSWVHYSLDHKKHSELVCLADYHLAISSGIKQQLIDRGVPEHRISVIFNPVTPQTIVIPRPTPNENAVFIYVGRLKFEGQKRLKDMLDALSGLTGNWECHFIGDGSDEAICKSYAQKLGLHEHTHWHGWQAEPWEYIQSNVPKVSALLLTSAFEGFGMVLAEAMSYGIYCVSSDCPSGPRDIIKNDVNGQLYPTNDLSVFQETLTSLIDGKNLPDAEKIKISIHDFYDGNYYVNLMKNINLFLKNKKW